MRIVTLTAALLAACGPLSADDEPRESSSTVFFRYSLASLTADRGGEVFTDTNGALGQANDDNQGWAVAAGLDLSLGHRWLDATVAGEIFVEHAEFSREKVVQTTSALLGAPRGTDVAVSQLTVAVAPKLRWEFGNLRPWIVPIGLAFLVNSPPSNDTTYLDAGLHFGVGADYLILDPLRAGLDVRYTAGFGGADAENDYWSIGPYVGIEF